jgi:hypothetical protein
VLAISTCSLSATNFTSLLLLLVILMKIKTLAIALAFLLTSTSTATAQYRSSGRHLNGLCQILIDADTLPCSQLAITGEDLDPSAGLNFQFQTGSSALVFVTSKEPYQVDPGGYSYYKATGMAFREPDGTFSNITKMVIEQQTSLY